MTGPPSLISQAVEEALNRTLALDAAVPRKLVKLEGCSLALDLAGSPIRFTLRVADKRFHVDPGVTEDADAIIRGTAGSLIAMGLSENTPAGKVEISGDAGVARQFQKLFSELDPDWEEPVTRLFGDVVGFQIAHALRRAWVWAKDAAQRFAGDATEYLVEESRVLVHPLQLEDYFEKVDDLRDDVARLERRVSDLRNRLA